MYVCMRACVWCAARPSPRCPAFQPCAHRYRVAKRHGTSYLCRSFSAKKTLNSDSFAERDLHLKVSYASSPPCTWQHTRREKNPTPDLGCRRIPGFPNAYSLLCVRIKASVYTYVSRTYRYTHTYTYMYAHIYICV